MNWKTKHSIFLICIQKAANWILTILFLFILPTYISPVWAIDSIPVRTLPVTPQEIPGEIIVQFKDGYSPQDLAQEVARRKAIGSTPVLGGIRIAAENFVLSQKGEKTPEEQLSQITTVKEQLRAQSRSLATPDASDESPSKDFHLIKTQEDISSDEMLKRYKALPQVASVEPNYQMYYTAVANDTYYSQMWQLTKMQVNQAWDITKGSTNVIAAVIDSGVAYDHPDLPTNNIIKGYNFGANTPDPYDGICGHGTHIAGTIGATTNNSIGISGLNWQVKIMAIKVGTGIDCETNLSIATIAQGIMYAADHGAKVINASVGKPGSCNNSPTMQQAINYARSKNVTIVVAAGNADPMHPNGSDASLFTPPSCSGVITVGATNPNDGRASFSNYGSVVALGAPGTQIISTYPPSSYMAHQGTSMAAPQVVGVIALMMSINPNLTPDQVKTILLSSADSITTDLPIGGKRLNAFKAVQAAQATLPQPTPTVTPTSVPPTVTPTLVPTITSSMTATPIPVQGDINRDGQVNLLDFTIWKCEFIGSGTCSNPSSNKSADINGDGIVNLLDFSLWRANYTL